MSRKPIKKSDANAPWIRKSQTVKNSPTAFRTRILVITQDKESSRIYFEALRRRLAQGAFELRVSHVSGSPLEVVKSVEGTVKAILGAIRRIPSKKDFEFDEIWVVFDRDSFGDFDCAVELTQKKGYKCGWSNECFELWYLLHKRDVSASDSLGRSDIFKELTRLLGLKKAYEKCKGRTSVNLHSEMANSKELGIALVRAWKLRTDIRLNSRKPSGRNPQTLVCDLIERLASQHPILIHG